MKPTARPPTARRAWTAYDQRMSWGAEAGATDVIGRSLASHGVRLAAIEANLADAVSPALIFDEAERRLGDITALVMCHGESVDSGLLDTTVESFDRHFAVNALAAAHELAHLAITANVINPGPVDTGWMSDEIQQAVLRETPLGRIGMPEDTANLVDFLCSPEGGWINGQLLKSNGGFS